MYKNKQCNLVKINLRNLVICSIQNNQCPKRQQITMKPLLLFLLITVPALVKDGFKIENHKIVWEDVFPADTDIKAILGGQATLKILSSGAGSYSGQGVSVKNTTEATSVRLKCDANFDFTITVVPEGYLVRVTNFMFLEKYGPSELRVIPNSLDKYYLEYGKIRATPKTQNDLSYVDIFLTGIFSALPEVQYNAITSN
jgi:hypothetical protein